MGFLDRISSRYELFVRSVELWIRDARAFDLVLKLPQQTQFSPLVFPQTPL